MAVWGPFHPLNELGFLGDVGALFQNNRFQDGHVSVETVAWPRLVSESFSRLVESLTIPGEAGDDAPD